MDFYFLCRHLPEKPSLARIIAPPGHRQRRHGRGRLGASTASRTLLLGTGGMGVALAMLCAIGAAVIVYLVLVIALRAVTLEDMRLIPKGDKLARILHIK